MEHENIFELYQSVDGWERVSDEIKTNIDSLITSGMISGDVFQASSPCFVTTNVSEHLTQLHVKRSGATSNRQCGANQHRHRIRNGELALYIRIRA